ncbi:hypothetical protein [Streptomyces salinarius]|uniref:hypothetical protein n=1 Tax=Streptomyces salinarius TaxID=2762598 RepID=UPI0013DAEAEC|nr:hypothetical protein [Streptomyces salinarius]
MKITDRMVTVPLGISLVLALGVGLLYALDLPPFGKERGAIRTDAVCATLGDDKSAADALNKILPDASSYDFEDSTTDRRTGGLDDTYESSCFVDGDGPLLLSARVTMLEYEDPDAWMRDAVVPFESENALEPFTAGEKSVASDKVAAIYSRCTSHGGNRHLSVIVRLTREGGAGAAAQRQGLIDLAQGTASYAHEAARCDVAVDSAREEDLLRG